MCPHKTFIVQSRCGFETFNLTSNILIMLNHNYGFKGAPRAWRKKLHRVLAQWMSCQQLKVEPELYCVRDSNQQACGNTLSRATGHDEDNQDLGGARILPAQQCEPSRFKCLLSVHVGDIKGTAARQTADSLLAHLNDKVSECKVDCGNFLLTGIQHEHSHGFVYTHQYVHIDSATPIESIMLIGNDEEALCATLLHEPYRSVLGVVAWTVLTRAELVVYVQALQGRAHAPRIMDCKRLDLVIRYMKRHKGGLKSVTFKHPLKLVGTTDGAFKAQPDEPTGLALRVLPPLHRRMVIQMTNPCHCVVRPI